LKTSPINDDRLKWYEEGFCDSEVADKVGVSPKAISDWRRSRGLPTVFENRKRLTEWEKTKIQDYLVRYQKYHHVTAEHLKRLERGLTYFVMSLRIPLAKVSQVEVENYVISFNDVDPARRDELLKTDLVKRLKVPDLPMYVLYGFASQIIAVRIFYRDKGCTVCKSIQPLHLHHLKGKYNLLEENLTTLCARCHMIVRHAARQYPGR
jgi:transcriptional regulator with XRE-family HTH domain